MTRIIKLSIMFWFMALFANTAEAASLFFTPNTGEFGVEKEIIVDLKIDSEGVGINAGQATIRFPKDVLSVKSIDKIDSVFNFWLEEPSFSNTDGAITFVGGTPYGVSGASIQVLHVVFTAKTSATAVISIADAAVTASDGSGTNVLTKTADSAFTISPTTIAPIITPPTQIKRAPVAPTGLPIKPAVTVPLYPNPTEWYNRSNIFAVEWKLPSDITEVATAVNKQPSYSPTTSEGLFDNKMFQPLSDGTWYLHVRFKNDIGWGPALHYRIGIDTQAPLPFEITSNEGELSDNPNLTLNFKTSDATSGVTNYQIKTDNKNWVTIQVDDFKGTFVQYNGEPGKHRITVRAVDGAGNSVEDTINHEVLPLTSPTFTFATDKLFSDESKGLSFKGTALPSSEILFTLKKRGAIIANNTVTVDAMGNWEFTFSDPVRNGKYIASIQNKDSRGAFSLVVSAPEILVSGRYTSTVIVLLVVLIGALGIGYWFYNTRRNRTALRIQIAESDTAKVFKMIETDIEKLSKARGTSTPADDEFITKKLGDNVKKMGSYIKDEIKRAKD